MRYDAHKQPDPQALPNALIWALMTDSVTNV